MDTRIVDFYKDKEGFRKCVNSIKKNNLVVFPTETVYGIGGNALSSEAVLKIFKVKERAKDNPLIVHVCNKNISSYAKNISDDAFKLIEKFWPGPLTLILEKKNIIPDETTAGRNTVAIRMPRNEIALELIRESGCPIAAPSANISGRPSGTNAKRCFDDLKNRIEFILDGENCEIGIESTVISMVDEIPLILRPGHITFKDIKNVIPNVKIYEKINEKINFENPISPGLKYKHYAPKCDMIIILSTKYEILKYIKNNFGNYKNVGILCVDENLDFYKSQNQKFKVISLGSRHDLNEIGKNLFEGIRSLDDLNCDFIVSECFSEDFSLAVMNRILKAASFNLVKL